MADPDFKLADFAKHTKVLFDCMESVTDKKPTMDRKAARDAIRALGDLLGPGEAADSGAPPDDPTRSMHSVDTKRASDSHVIHSIDAIFTKDGEDTGASGIDAIFTRKRLAEG